MKDPHKVAQSILRLSELVEKTSAKSPAIVAQGVLYRALRKFGAKKVTGPAHWVYEFEIRPDGLGDDGHADVTAAIVKAGFKIVLLGKYATQFHAEYPGPRGSVADIKVRFKTYGPGVAWKISVEQEAPDYAYPITASSNTTASNGNTYSDFVQLWWEAVESSTEKALKGMDGVWPKLNVKTKGDDYRHWVIEGIDEMSFGNKYEFRFNVLPEYRKGYVTLEGIYLENGKRIANKVKDIGLQTPVTEFGELVAALVGHLMEMSGD